MWVTDAELTHSADARSGVATADVAMYPDVSTADATVKITYHDGTSDIVPMQIANPAATAETWRLVIGSPAGPSVPGYPSPASAPAITTQPPQRSP
jgi:hypothetical protein